MWDQNVTKTIEWTFRYFPIQLGRWVRLSQEEGAKYKPRAWGGWVRWISLVIQETQRKMSIALETWV